MDPMGGICVKTDGLKKMCIIFRGELLGPRWVFLPQKIFDSVLCIEKFLISKIARWWFHSFFLNFHSEHWGRFPF